MSASSSAIDEEVVGVEVSDEFLGDADLRASAEARLRESIGCLLAVRPSAPGTVVRSDLRLARLP